LTDLNLPIAIVDELRFLIVLAKIEKPVRFPKPDRFENQTKLSLTYFAV